MNIKIIILKQGLTIAAFFLLCNFVFGKNGSFKDVDSNQIPDILNIISDRVYQNFKKIHMLEGKSENSSYTVYKGKDANELFRTQTNSSGKAPEKIAILSESTNTFSSDFDKELLYAKMYRDKPQKFINLSDGNNLGTKYHISSCNVSILTPEYYLHSDSYIYKNNKPVQRQAVRENTINNDPNHHKQSVFDLRNMFDVTDPVWKEYPFYAERIKKDGKYAVDGYNLKAEELVLDDDVQYRISEPVTTNSGEKTINLWWIKTFSVKAGYNMISYDTVQADGKTVCKKSLEYKLQNDIYVPVKDTYEAFDLEDGSLLYRQTSVLKDFRLNQPIPEDRFTHKSLELEEGDTFIDKVLNKKFIYKKGELSEVQ